jgi:hypothetical protein
MRRPLERALPVFGLAVVAAIIPITVFLVRAQPAAA